MFVFQDQCGWKSDLPTIVSVCLISLEPDNVLRVMRDQFTQGKITTSQHDRAINLTEISLQTRDSDRHANLSTPKEVSVNHILVFPTSALE